MIFRLDFAANTPTIIGYNQNSKSGETFHAPLLEASGARLRSTGEVTPNPSS